MKFSETWLREWVNPELDLDSVCDRLTKAGHEVDSVTVYGNDLDAVVIGEILAVAPHENADRLRVCTVSTGGDETLQIVCGAPNARAGLKSPLAQPGCRLPGGLKIRKSKIRGVESFGMLCSAVELGLGSESDGIMELPADAPTGGSLSDYLGLPDAIIDVDLTPNRGDCFSVLGIARDLSALTGASLKDASAEPAAATTDASHPVVVEDASLCPSFAGQLVTGIRADAETPLWMAEQLRRAGLRPIHPVVDITNFVMLELGQPLHAYDQALLQGAIRPRLAQAGETLTLLDGKSITLNPTTTIIADDRGPIGLAGIMGGESTAVSDKTINVLFEAAFWPTDGIAGQARSYGLHTDASLRFERGVDPRNNERAVQRATGLLLSIAGGEAGPLALQLDESHLPKREAISLREDRIERLLGLKIERATVTDILKRLELDVTETETGWEAVPPSHRFDLEIEADLIEEVARIYGYDEIPLTTSPAPTPLAPLPEERLPLDRLSDSLIARDFQEVITYSFIDSESDTAVSGIESRLVLSNPISSEMSVMRSSLWPGMLRALSSNLARQRDRVRLFEIGKTFRGEPGAHTEQLSLGGVVAGPAVSEQWGSKSRSVDFFDIKGDLEALLALAADADQWVFEAADHPALQPGQTAMLRRAGAAVGYIGKLHPRLGRLFDLKRDAFLFEVDADVLLSSTLPKASEVSRYPSIRRDISVLVASDVTAQALTEAVRATAPDLIADVRVFDVYTGDGVEAGRKSVALGLILQETSRTLTDDDADAAMTAAVGKLKQQFAAELRE